MFRFILSLFSKTNSSKTRFSKQSLAKEKKLKSISKRHPFAAVKICASETSACQEALDKADIFYLRTEAPLLPLPSCTNRLNCKCRYEHFTDRRRDIRRDSDVGFLHHFSGDNRRRAIQDRRAS